MAYIELNKKKLKKNYEYLNDLFKKNEIAWSVVSKVFCGNTKYLKELINLGVSQVCDSRLTNLRIIKQLAPHIETIYIKPPPVRIIDEVVRYADISLNTEINTIELLSDAASKLGRTHKIMIMIELGELREGVLREDLIDFYSKVFRLPSIEVVGIGTNLTCMYGVLPSHDKLIQLSLYKQLIEAKFNRKISYVSGGSSVTIPLIFENLLPAGINHFRVGETLYLGTDVYHNKTFPDMEKDVFRLYAEIIELSEKENIPVGAMGTNLKGQKMTFESGNVKSVSHRAIIDLGLLDIEENHIKLRNKDIKIVGASSDMLVLDLGKNKSGYKVGDLLEFDLDYMGLLRIMNSRYIEKRIV